MTVTNRVKTLMNQRLERIIKNVRKTNRGSFCESYSASRRTLPEVHLSFYAGVPDRLVLLPDGHMGFVEMKSPGKHPRPLQVQRLMQLKQLGFQVFVCDQLDQIGGMLDAIQTA